VKSEEWKVESAEYHGRFDRVMVPIKPSMPIKPVKQVTIVKPII
jgi:hypothetical protein